MDDAKRDSPGAPPGPDAQRRRPQPPVLDLKATEVKATPDKGAEPARPAGEQPIPEPERTAPADNVAGEAFAQGAVPPGAPGTPPNDAKGAGRPPGNDHPRSWQLAAAAALMGATTGVLATLATVWVSGVTGRGKDEAAAARVAKLEAAVQEVAARPALSPDAVRDVAARTAAGEQALQAVRELQAALARTQTALADLRARPGPLPDERVGQLDATAKTLRDEVAALRKRLDDTAREAQTARDTAMRSEGSSSTAAASAAGEIDALAQRIQTLEASAKALQEKVAAASGPDRDRTARFAAVALALRVAVESAEPYAAELAAMKALVPDAARLRPLDAAAAEGIASANALSRELSRRIVSMRQSAEPSTTGSGLLDRLQASAEKLVTIRRAGEAAAPAEGDALAALETKAARGDLAGALTEAEKLAAPQRAPLDAWIRKARARADALEISRALVHESAAALGGEAAARP